MTVCEPAQHLPLEQDPAPARRKVEHSAGDVLHTRRPARKHMLTVNRLGDDHPMSIGHEPEREPFTGILVIDASVAQSQGPTSSPRFLGRILRRTVDRSLDSGVGASRSTRTDR